MGIVAAGAALIIVSAEARAQKRPPQEFTRQELLIANFQIDSGADLRIARRIADALRSRTDKLSNGKEVNIISGGDLRLELTKASFPSDSALSRPELRLVGSKFRTDEFVVGTVERAPGGVRLRSQLVLVRDERFIQPLPVVSGNEPDKIADQVAKSLVSLRAAIPYERRCENHLRDGRASEAAREARAGIALVPRGTLARICLVLALRSVGTPAATLLEEARAILALHSESAYALEAAAIALDSLRRRDEAGNMWVRFLATDSNNVSVIQRVVWSLAFGGNSAKAEPIIIQASENHPENLELLRQRWFILAEIKRWPGAIEAGELVLARDTTIVHDSTFFLKLATAYRANAQPFKSIETIARGVALFPKDARLYALYTQFLRAEADTVIPRGLALFPRSAELLALNAQLLRSRGKVAESLEASRMAVSIDPGLKQGELLIAQAEMELGRPDSALAALRRALARGDDSTLVAQFALSKGNALSRAANGTKSRDDFQLAMRFLAFADSVRPSVQAKFLRGAAAFSVAQSALTDAPTAADKARSCELARLGAESLPVALAGIEAGQEVAPEAAKQYLDYLGKLQPYADKQLEVYCIPAHFVLRTLPALRTANGLRSEY
jgi:tetratricopeptide (TPR) repeat protein